MRRGALIVAAYIFLQLTLSNGTGMGPHRCAILEAVDQFGSISAAARAVSRTYPWVWKLVQEMNEMYGEVIAVQNGGPKSGATLTSRGKTLVALYRGMERKVRESLEDDLKKFERFGGENPRAPEEIPRHLRVVDPDKQKKEKIVKRRRG
jgi:molybdate transport system regulatory protein